MKELSLERKKINEMAALVLSMVTTTFEGFMEHDPEILSRVLEYKEKINVMEKDITVSLINSCGGKVDSSCGKDAVALSSIAVDMEEIGDILKDMIERIEIKIGEKLLFSDEALSEYRHLYSVVESAFRDVESALKMDDKDFVKRLLCDKEHAERISGTYRKVHTERLLSGACDPRAGNMFSDLINFNAEIYRHIVNIAENITKLG